MTLGPGSRFKDGIDIKLDELVNKNWDVEAIVNDRQKGRRDADDGPCGPW